MGGHVFGGSGLGGSGLGGPSTSQAPQTNPEMMNMVLSVRKSDVIYQIPDPLKGELRRINDGIVKEGYALKELSKHMQRESSLKFLGTDLEFCETTLQVLEFDISELVQLMAAVEESVLAEKEHAQDAETNLAIYNVRGIRQMGSGRFPSRYMNHKVGQFVVRLKRILNVCDKLEIEANQMPSELSESKLAELLISQQESLQAIALNIGRVHLQIESLKQRYITLRQNVIFDNRDPFVPVTHSHPRPLLARSGRLSEHSQGPAPGGLFGPRPSFLSQTTPNQSQQQSQGGGGMFANSMNASASFSFR